MKHTESKLQQACVKWFRLQYPNYAKLLFAIPNGGARNAVTGSLLKAEGVVAGVPDLFLAEWGGFDEDGRIIHGLFIEMKAPGEKPTPKQKEMHELLSDQDYQVEVCDSFEEFQRIINNYLQ